MRAYGKIETGFWQNKKAKALSEPGRYLFLYVLTTPHGNSVGCFVLPFGYISADLKWTEEVVTERVRELVEKGCVEYDETTSLVRVRGWWGHNTLENANVAKGALKTFRQLPRCEVYYNAIKALNETTNPSTTKFINPLRNEFADVFATPSLTKPNLTEPEPNPTKPNPAAKIVDKKSGDAKEPASRALRTKSPDTSDPANRKAVWEQKCVAWMTAHWPAERAQAAIVAYLEGTPFGKAEYETASAEMGAERTDGSIKAETRLDRPQTTVGTALPAAYNRDADLEIPEQFRRSA
jgi:hypothetical protein